MKLIRFESGVLAQMYPSGIQLEADTPAEAIMGLQGYPGFREEEGDRHVVTLPQFQSRDSLYQLTDVEEIVVVPVQIGAGGRGVFQIVLGVVLIVVGAIATAYGQPWGATLMKMGFAMVISGVVQALMPQPELRRQSESDSRSAYLPANRNTTRIGTPIPLLFGRRRVWGHILTFNVSATNRLSPSLPQDNPGWDGSSDTGWSDGTVVGGSYLPIEYPDRLGNMS